MMFDVISQIQVEKVPNSKVVVSLHTLDKFVMFSYDMNGSRMSTDWNETCDQNVGEGSSAPEFVDKKICANDYDKVNEFINGHFLVHENEGS